MKRVIIRTLGTLIAIFSGVVPRIVRAAEYNVSGVSGHAQYTGSYTAQTVNGFFVATNQFNLFSCQGDPGAVTCSGWSPATVCYSSAGGSSGTGTGTGTGGAVTTVAPASTAEYSMRCEWYKCMQDYNGGQVEKCSGASRCNGTGVYCSRSGFFDDIKINGADTYKNWTYTPDSWLGTPTGAKYYFVACDTGWYQAHAGAPCNTATAYSGTSQFSGCCIACPGFVNFNPETASGTTYVHNMDTNATGGYRWVSTGVGITSCIAFPPNSTYSDAAGTYSLTGGCPYIL